MATLRSSFLHASKGKKRRRRANKMDTKPSLSQYFGGPDPPTAAQFFDETVTAASGMIQSIYLGDDEVLETTSASATPQNMTVCFTQKAAVTEPENTSGFSNILASTITPLNAANLPDPSTFFDNITSEASHVSPVTDTSKFFDNIASETSLVSPVISSIDIVDTLNVATTQVDRDAERRRDAWIPNEETQKTFIKAHSSPKGAFFPDREVMTMPGLILDEELSDSLQDAAVKHLGIGAWGNRSAMRADHVSRDEGGLRELLRTGYLRAAVNLTGSLLEACGQGVGKLNRPSKHTPRTLQIWLTRFAIMARIKLYDVLAKEAEAFGDFAKPDMYYQLYGEQYGNRVGSLVPFSLRLLVAEAPAAVAGHDAAIDKLYHLYATIQKMLSNLHEGKTEDGSSTITTESDKTESIRLWSGRQIRVVHSIVNCAIAVKDYRLAIKLLSSLSSAPDLPARQQRSLAGALCRLCLQAGHVFAAKRYLQEATVIRQNSVCPTPDVREYIDHGLCDMAQGHLQDAYNNFAKAADQEPTNIMVANNLAVCLLYMGKLKDAITILEKALNSDPERGLNESLLMNLCTLYELESSNPKEKKLSLLRMLCKYKSDSLPNVMECLKLNS